MGHGGNANNDDLPQLRANFNEATQALFLHMNAPQDDFGPKFARIQFDAKLLSQALLRAAPHVSMELSEAYTLKVNTVPSITSFLCIALMEFRRRRGNHFLEGIF